MESHGFEMKGAISSADGVDTITIAPGTGKVTIAKNLGVDGVTQFDGDVVVATGSPVVGHVLFTTDSEGTLSYVYGSVPTGETILFEDNTAVTGYSLNIDHDDSVVYITKGSDEGGETGGTNKSGGTWTQSTHNHGGYTGGHAVTIAEMASHRHEPINPNKNFICNRGFGATIRGGNNYYFVKYTGYTGGGETHRHTLGSVGGDGTVNTWRPYGRNFTRQTKL
jgi:hypothetical protein